jgi:catechol 2,3-dioxygenase-like lactoylglutathione lyase family enzyme
LTDRNLDFAPLVPELLCKNVADSIDFYCGILGFSKLYGRDKPPFAYLDREGAQLMLEQFEPEGWLTGDMHLPFGRGINFQIEVSDLAPLLQALENAGTTLFLEPEEAWYAGDDRLYGQHQFLVQDPDGYLLRFCQDLGERMQDNLPETGRIRA